MQAAQEDQLTQNENGIVPLHPSFQSLGLNRDLFDSRGNRDFRITANCARGENRGGFPYTPPEGWNQYGLKVARTFPNDEAWLGISNGAGEWAVVYHGTKSSLVSSIIQSPLRPGGGNSFGRGIYCSPNPQTAEGYADVLQVQTNTGTLKCKFVLACRVNVSAVHCCTACPCPCAQDNNYTVHVTSSDGIWFVNGGNEKYQYIRPYGLLVKEVP
jgi:hypothetical protein